MPPKPFRKTDGIYQDRLLRALWIWLGWWHFVSIPAYILLGLDIHGGKAALPLFLSNSFWALAFAIFVTSPLYLRFYATRFHDDVTLAVWIRFYSVLFIIPAFLVELYYMDSCESLGRQLDSIVSFDSGLFSIPGSRGNFEYLWIAFFHPPIEILGLLIITLAAIAIRAVFSSNADRVQSWEQLVFCQQCHREINLLPKNVDSFQLVCEACSKTFCQRCCRSAAQEESTSEFHCPKCTTGQLIAQHEEDL